MATSAHVLFLTDFLIDLAGVFADFLAVFGVFAAVENKSTHFYSALHIGIKVEK